MDSVLRKISRQHRRASAIKLVDQGRKEIGRMVGVVAVNCLAYLPRSELDYLGVTCMLCDACLYKMQNAEIKKHQQTDARGGINPRIHAFRNQ